MTDLLYLLLALVILNKLHHTPMYGIGYCNRKLHNIPHAALVSIYIPGCCVQHRSSRSVTLHIPVSTVSRLMSREKAVNAVTIIVSIVTGSRSRQQQSVYTRVCCGDLATSAPCLARPRTSATSAPPPPPRTAPPAAWAPAAPSTGTCTATPPPAPATPSPCGTPTTWAGMVDILISTDI